jgi:predicted O-methyltransferase YrrM
MLIRVCVIFCVWQKQYLTYYHAVMGNETHDGILAPNGIILADNVLWKGVVLNHVPELKSDAPLLSSFPNPKRMEKMATVMHEFNAHVSRDPRVRCTMLPLRDGLMIIQKK